MVKEDESEIIKLCEELEKSNSVKIPFNDEDEIDSVIIDEIQRQRMQEQIDESKMTYNQLKDKHINGIKEANDFAKEMGMKIIPVEVVKSKRQKR